MVKCGSWGCTPNIFISHQCYIYKRCLTTFICCGCAYGCVPTTLWFLMPTYILECCQKSGLLPGDKWWWNAVLEAAHPTYSSHINVIYIKGVWQPLYAVDVHMDVSPPRYGCPCLPSFWNVVRNMGDSQAIVIVKCSDWGFTPNPYSSTSMFYI
jgi:hypothetical protein